MLRFAASPTGDMHVGDLRIALINYIVSKQRDEDLIVRIEDIDKDKNIDGKDNEILDILGLFGIEYSQVIHQSQNVRFHTAMALQLLHEKKAFSCFCSDDWLDKKREEAKENKEAYKYDDACANLPAELVIDNTNPFSVRIRKSEKNIVIKDHLKGEITFEAKDMESFVILNQDKTPTYNYACAVDDMLSDISLVVCDEELVNNTPKQDLVRTSLGYDKKIEYAHLPMISNDKDFTVKSLLEQGFLPSSISNYLISIGNSVPNDIFSIEDAVKWFDFKMISKSPSSFDMEILKDINRQHLKSLDAKELSRYVGFADAEIGELARIYLDEVCTTKELKSKIEPIFAQKVIPEEFTKQANAVSEIIKSAPYFEEYADFQKYLMEKSDLKEENIVKTLRILLTGAEDGPEIADIYKYLKNYIGEIIK